MHHVLEFVPYQRVRPASEYTVGPFRESRVTAELAKEYGFSTVEIEKVTIETLTGDLAIVRGSIQPGTEVVIEGQSQLRPHAKVNVVQPQPKGQKK